MARGDRIQPAMPPEDVVAAREALGMTQQQLADALHLGSPLSKRTIGSWERGRRPVPGPEGVAIRLMVELHNLKAAKRRGRKAAAGE